MISKDFIIGLIISIITVYLILLNYKKIQFNKKYKVVLFILGVILFFISIILKTTFIYKSIISTIILSIITPIEMAIIAYFGVDIIKRKGDKK